MIYTNKQNLPESLYRAIANDPYQKTGHYSATQLPQPPQILELRRRYSDKITMDISDLIYPLVGNNTHYILERMGIKNALQEERLQYSVSGKIISGKPDFYDADKTLWDYKVTTRFVLIDGVKPDWEAQMNIYAFLLAIYKFGVKAANICCIFRDWSKIQANRVKDYPQHQVSILPVKLWALDAVYDYIADRIEKHELARHLPDSELPECEPDERWAKPTTYAVKKKGRKKAVRVLDSRKNADGYIREKNLGNDHFVEERKGESTRCEYYCEVKDYCHQYNHKITRGS